MEQKPYSTNVEILSSEKDPSAVRSVEPIPTIQSPSKPEDELQDVDFEDPKEARKSLLSFLVVVAFFELYWGVGGGSCFVCWFLVFIGTFFWTVPEENEMNTELVIATGDSPIVIDSTDRHDALQSGEYVSETVLTSLDEEKIDSHGQMIWTTMGNFFLPLLVSFFFFGIAADFFENVLNQDEDMTMELASIVSGVAFFAYLLHRYSIVLGGDKLQACFSLNKLTLALILPTLMIMIVDFVGSIPIGVLAEILFPSDMEQIPISDESSLSDPIFLTLLFTSIVIIAPITEELAFRGLILDFLREKYGNWPAIIVSSILFGIVHFIPVAIAVATFGGLIYGWLRIRTDSLWPGIFCHAIWNIFAFSMFLHFH